MALKTSAADRSSLLRKAASLPNGNVERRGILAALRPGKKTSSGPWTVRPFISSDYWGWAGAEQWDNEHPPYILEGEVGKLPDGTVGDFSVVIIGDSEGYGIHFQGDGGEEGPMYYKRGADDPEVAEHAMAGIGKIVKSGRIPSGFRLERM